MSHMRLLSPQGPQPALIGEACLGDFPWGQAVDEVLIGLGKPAYLEYVCVDKCPAGLEC